MRFKSLVVSTLSLSLFAMFPPSFHGQVVPAAHQETAPLEVGIGASTWYTDWGPSPMVGITTTVDYHPPLPGKLNGLGAEFEYRDVDWHRTVQPSNYRQQTIGGGPTYSIPFRQNFRFYGKFILAEGSQDFMFPSIPGYTHDTRLVYAPGVGVQYHLLSNVWLRGDYEYQIWQPLFSPTSRPTPSGFTFGVAYDVRSFRRHS